MRRDLAALQGLPREVARWQKTQQHWLAGQFAPVRAGCREPGSGGRVTKDANAPTRQLPPALSRMVLESLSGQPPGFAVDQNTQPPSKPAYQSFTGREGFRGFSGGFNFNNCSSPFCASSKRFASSGVIWPALTGWPSVSGLSCFSPSFF